MLCDDQAAAPIDDADRRDTFWYRWGHRNMQWIYLIVVGLRPACWRADADSVRGGPRPTGTVTGHRTKCVPPGPSDQCWQEVLVILTSSDRHHRRLADLSWGGRSGVAAAARCPLVAGAGRVRDRIAEPRSVLLAFELRISDKYPRGVLESLTPDYLPTHPRPRPLLPFIHAGAEPEFHRAAWR